MNAIGAVSGESWIVACALALLVACSSGGGGGGSDGAATACDPAAQTGCPTGEKCDLTCSGGASVFACVPENGTVAVGEACSPTSPCQGGGFCASTATTPTPTCVRFCATTADCASGTCRALPATAPTCPQPTTASVCD